MVEGRYDNELLLVWKHPDTRLRYTIGRLWQTQSGYHFCYECQAMHSLEDATRDGFRLLDSFPNPEEEFHSEELFATFERRLPPSWDVDLRDLGNDSGDPMEYLRVTGGRVSTDTLEFLEPVQIGEEARAYTIRFPVAGWQYYDGESVITRLQEGMPLYLELETDNAFDPNAIRVLASFGAMLGYVPAIYAWYIDESVANQTYDAAIEEIGAADNPRRRLVMRVEGRNESVGLPPDFNQALALMGSNL